MAKTGRTGAAATAPPPAKAAVTDEEARIKALYSIMQSIENKLGGGEGVEGLYGSIKKGGMDRVLECMRQKCGLDARSVLVDVGAGLGRPLMHALLSPGIAGARGIEIDRIKCDKAAAFLRQAIAQLARRGVIQDAQVAPPEIECSAIERVRSLDPCTHAYSFWEGVPVDGKAGFGRLFAASRTLRSVAVVQRAIRTCPVAYMADLGFGELVLVGSFAVSMSGSGRSFTAYVFNKAALPLPLPPPAAAEAAAAHSVETPAQEAEPAPAAPSALAWRAAEEAEGETAQSRLAEAGQGPPGTAASGGAARHGRRQRKPSAKQKAAAEAEQAVALQAQAGLEHAATRQQKTFCTAEPVQQSAEQQAEQPAAQPAEAARQAQAAERAAAPPRSPRRAGRSIPPPAGAALAIKSGAPHSAKLSSPPRGGVHKRTSPVKPAAVAGAVPATTPRRSQRRLAQPGAAAAKGAASKEQLPAPGAGGLLLQPGSIRVVKAGVAAAGKSSQAAVRRSTRRGLLEGT